MRRSGLRAGDVVLVHPRKGEPWRGVIHSVENESQVAVRPVELGVGWAKEPLLVAAYLVERCKPRILAPPILVLPILALQFLGSSCAAPGGAQPLPLPLAGPIDEEPPPVALAQPLVPPRAVRPKLRLDLGPEGRLLAARVGANEDSRPLRPNSGGGTSGAPTEDHLGILQVVATVAGRHGLEPEEALRRLAPRVAGGRPTSRRRQLLSAALPASGEPGPPPGWETALDGDWSVHGPLWHRFRAKVEQLAREGFEPPCPGEPIAWGCEEDDERALARGLVRLDCGETVNRFWSRPWSSRASGARSTALPARMAAGAGREN